MDPLSITAGIIGILQLTGKSGQIFRAVLSLKNAPQQLQQLWNEAQALRGKSKPLPDAPPALYRYAEILMSPVALLLETGYCLHRRSADDGYARIEALIAPVLKTVEAHVLEFEQLIW